MNILPFCGRHAAAATCLCVAIYLAFFGWLVRVPNPGIAYQEVLDSQGVPQRTIIQFSAFKNFKVNLTSNILWIMAAICILAAVLITIRFLIYSSELKRNARDIGPSGMVQPK